MRVFLVGAFIGAMLFGWMLVESGGDPFVIAAIGQDDPELLSLIEEDLGRTIVTRPGPGHDGRMFFVQALDPFYQGELTASTDRPLYRGQRMLYPLLAGLGGVLPLRFVPWGMALINVLSFGFGTLALARYAAIRGFNQWWGLSFALNPGLWAGIEIGGASAPALALGVAGVLMVARDRMVWAALAFTGCVLTREVMLIMVGGVVLQYFRSERRLSFPVIVLPIGASVTWGLFLRTQIAVEAADVGVSTNFGPPFAGILQAAGVWSGSPITFAFAIATIGVLVLIVVQAVRETDLLLGAVAPFGLLFFVLSPAVLNASFDYSRAVAPAYLGLGLIVANRLDSERREHPVTLPTGAADDSTDRVIV
ncbi:MAG: hypothetical protein HKN03_07945 [Acidimicrobiales bacterium]|nr:hypothetical protein [Acidimicrobiales bacterium]